MSWPRLTRNKLSLVSELTILFALAIVLSVGIIGLVSFRSTEYLLKDRILQDLDALATARQDEIALLIEHNFDIAKLIASRTKAREYPSHSGLIEDMRSVRSVQQISVLDRQGKVLVSTDPVLIGKKMAGDKLFDKAIKGTDSGSLDSFKGQIYYSAAVPLYSEVKSPSGVLIIKIEQLALKKLLSDYTGLGITGELILVNRQAGNLELAGPLRHPVDPKGESGQKLVLGMLESMVREKEFSIIRDYRGEQVLLAFRFIPDVRWGLVLKIDAAEAFLPIIILRQRVFMAGMLLTLFGIILSWFFARLITRRIHGFRVGALRVGKGELGYRLPISGEEEIIAAELEFNKMADRLQAYIIKHDRLERLYKNVVESSLDGITFFDAQGTIVSINHPAALMFGLSRDKIIGRNLFEIESPAFTDLKKYQQIVAAVLKGKETGPTEINFQEPNGKVSAAEVRFNLIKEGTSPYGLQAISRRKH